MALLLSVAEYESRLRLIVGKHIKKRLYPFAFLDLDEDLLDIWTVVTVLYPNFNWITLYATTDFLDALRIGRRKQQRLSRGWCRIDDLRNVL